MVWNEAQTPFFQIPSPQLDGFGTCKLSADGFQWNFARDQSETRPWLSQNINRKTVLDWELWVFKVGRREKLSSRREVQPFQCVDANETFGRSTVKLSREVDQISKAPFHLFEISLPKSEWGTVGLDRLFQHIRAAQSHWKFRGVENEVASRNDPGEKRDFCRESTHRSCLKCEVSLGRATGHWCRGPRVEANIVNSGAANKSLTTDSFPRQILINFPCMFFRYKCPFDTSKPSANRSTTNKQTNKQSRLTERGRVGEVWRTSGGPLDVVRTESGTGSRYTNGAPRAAPKTAPGCFTGNLLAFLCSVACLVWRLWGQLPLQFCCNFSHGSSERSLKDGARFNPLRRGVSALQLFKVEFWVLLRC